MKEYAHIYIDFDGVMCNSVLEAFVSSYLAYHNRAPVDGEKIEKDSATRSLFYAYRPFIRSGGHFMLLQHCIARDIPLVSQSSFEAALQSISKRQLMRWRATLHDVRDRMIEQRLSYYLSLHGFYEHVSPYLRRLSCATRVSILSTKKAELISVLLARNNIEWPATRIISDHTRRKIDLIKERHTLGTENVIFIDDHLPHIFSAEEGERNGIECYLADWGYVLPEWKENVAYRHVDAHSLSSLLIPFL